MICRCRFMQNAYDEQGRARIVREGSKCESVTTDKRRARCCKCQALLAAIVIPGAMLVLLRTTALGNVINRMRQSVQTRAILSEQYEHGDEHRDEAVIATTHQKDWLPGGTRLSNAAIGTGDEACRIAGRPYHSINATLLQKPVSEIALRPLPARTAAALAHFNYIGVTHARSGGHTCSIALCSKLPSGFVLRLPRFP